MTSNRINAASEFEMKADTFLASSSSEIVQDDINPLIESLRQNRSWDRLLRVIEKVGLSPESSVRIAVAYLEGHRGLGRHDEALEYLLLHYTSPSDPEIETQWAILLCEAGDFRAALDMLKPLTTPMSRASDELLNVRGWAHQNSYNGTHGEEGAEVYAEALSRSSRTSSGGAKQKAEITRSMSHKVNQPESEIRLKELWYRKGYANALIRIPERKADAVTEYKKIIALAQAEIKISPCQPFAMQVIGWCYYRLGEFQSAATAYKEALDADIPRLSPQFDYALMLFSMGRVSTALSQYRTAIVDARELNPLRRAGLLRVALFEFCDALLGNNTVQEKPQASQILQELSTELRTAISKFRPALGNSAARIQCDAEQLMAECGKNVRSKGGVQLEKALQVLNWEATTIIGFQNPRRNPCGLFVPVVRRDQDGRDMRFVLSPRPLSRPDEPPTATLVELDPKAELQAIAFLQPATPMTRIIYLSDNFLRSSGMSSGQLPRIQSSSWQSAGEFSGSFAACVSLDEGVRLLENIGQDLIATTVKELKQPGKEANPALAERVKMAFLAARNQGTLFQAALCYATISNELLDVSTLREDVQAGLTPDPETVRKAVPHFRKLLQLLPDPLYGGDAKVVSECAAGVLKRAAEISAIRDDERRAREAVWAAAEVAAIVPLDAQVEAIQHQLANKLRTRTVLYLDSEKETLVLAREPAFYCSFKIPELSKPALDAFAFFKAPSHLHSGRFVDGPIATIAKVFSR